jgi:hypothetical protein
MAGKADLVNSIADSVDGTAAASADDDAAYAALDAAVAAAGEPIERGGGWMADG